ncbi:MAG: hypothetical protein KGJ79_15215 [Alphaproteobacteria bacterium]|nr:hypothetical protein [Alphaproteobacteria bacterium]MDE2112491.1 hypothetical protein [Alphaproteobacteria bacterium]MDE2494215.1 hypothetical protein [Alphaproteobacteria bacterium]
MNHINRQLAIGAFVAATLALGTATAQNASNHLTVPSSGALNVEWQSVLSGQIGLNVGRVWERRSRLMLKNEGAYLAEAAHIYCHQVLHDISHAVGEFAAHLK